MGDTRNEILKVLGVNPLIKGTFMENVKTADVKTDVNKKS